MKVHMRALLPCLKPAIEAADQGLSKTAILEAFITEVDIEANLQAYYDALSTENLPVESVDSAGAGRNRSVSGAPCAAPFQLFHAQG